MYPIKILYFFSVEYREKMRRWQLIGSLILVVIQSSFLVKSQDLPSAGKKIIGFHSSKTIILKENNISTLGQFINYYRNN